MKKNYIELQHHNVH